MLVELLDHDQLLDIPVLERRRCGERVVWLVALPLASTDVFVSFGSSDAVGSFHCVDLLFVALWQYHIIDE